MARWSRVGRAANEAERSSAVSFFFRPAQGVPTRREIIIPAGVGISFSFSNFRFHPIYRCFCGAVPCCAFSFAHIRRRKDVCAYVHAASWLFSWMEHGALGACKSPVCTNCLDHRFRSIFPSEQAQRAEPSAARNAL